MNWITNYVRPRINSLFSRREVPENLWTKCPECGTMLFHRELSDNLNVCTNCDHHMAITPRDRFAALFDGGELELTEPGESEDTGVDWLDPRALTSYGDRGPTESWSWSGPARVVEGRTWGGCLDVLDEIGLAGRMPELDDLRGGILLLETSEELPSPRLVSRWVRALGERGVLDAVAGVLVARPPVSTFGDEPDAETRRARREAQCDVFTEMVGRYNPDAVVSVGVPFGHTRPQWIVPYGGTVRLDGVERRVFASYD